MLPVVAAVAGNVLSNVIGNAVNWFSNNQNNAENRALAAQQNQWALNMWRLNNEYNSPLAQMERLRAAGINPALAYANGADNTSAQVADTADTPQMRPFVASPFQVDVNALSQAEVAKAQADLYRAQAADILGDTPESKARIYKLGKEASKYESDIELNRQRIDESLKQIEVLDEEKKKKIVETAHIHFEEQMRSAEFDENKKHIAAMVNMLNAQAGLYRMQSKEVEQQVEFLVRSLEYRLLGEEYKAEGLNLANDKAIREIVDLEYRLIQGEITLEDMMMVLKDKKYYNANRDGNVFLRGLDLISHFVGNAFSGALRAVVPK